MSRESQLAYTDRIMLPRLNPERRVPQHYQAFLADLRASGFSGEISTDYATRLTAATDNSVYQVLPIAVVFPKDRPDVERLLKLAHQEKHRAVKVSPRGGGTGTNGQSLCDGVIVDLSRHLANILELDLNNGWVRVQPGVVLDQLNTFLAPHGVFFAPNLSPSNRATLGGMVSTDASGKGSRIYGKTSDHVLGLELILTDGSLLQTRPLNAKELAEACEAPGLAGEIYREVRGVIEKNRDRIATALPNLKRFLTGYDLAHCERADGLFDLSRVICGSEGTLGILTEATLKLTKLPKHKQLFAIRYSDFDAALRAANLLVRSNPGAIETIDDTIVTLAKGDTIWHSVAHLLNDSGEPPLRAVNLVEFESDDPNVVSEKVRELSQALDRELGQPGKATGYTVADKKPDIAALWTLRKKGVGLLGNAKGERRPVPFVEDTAVPPEHLADYIQEFRALLDRHGLFYGMFGHVDVGCLHVRPALNMRDEADEALLHQLSDDVVALVKKYGGVLWGEHGRGYRSSYTPSFFGPELYEELRRVKGAFDPHNQLNPGKLATPITSLDELVSLKATKRGTFDRQILPQVRQEYAVAVHCNGNGACFDWSPDSVMCPSSKVTRDRIHSPKGRAGILREWLRLTTLEGHNVSATAETPTLAFVNGRAADPADFSHEVYDAMNGCLACKACATQCPIKVDVPNLRAQFLEQYHTRYRRPLKDYFVAMLEAVLGWLVLWPKLSNCLLSLSWAKSILRWVGIVDTPLLAEATLSAGLRERSAPTFDLDQLSRLSPEEKARTVCIAQDAFTTYYEPGVTLAAYDLLTRLGRRVVVLPFVANGKALHVKGFLGWFRAVAAKGAAFYSQVSALGIPIVGIEPAVTLTYRDEYPHALGQNSPPFGVLLLQEYLSSQLPEMLSALGDRAPKLSAQYRLFGHCTERTAEPKSQSRWAEVFQAFGSALTLEGTGCCGMCGVYGHEAEHVKESRGVFEMSWEPKLPKTAELQSQVLATGHSCRSQVKRFSGFVPRHPVEVLAEAVR
ncbi:MAG: FAD-binding and (Fe-S)-binding domain-containing protein [Polyangiaceae bacterium]|nr:FAD-binding and (Fe-S)-binding domain-containing protein [Polyangiaceae bacterium]